MVSRETILVVEDEDFVREATSELLRNCGHDVLSASDGVTARHLFTTCIKTVALLLCDAVLPGESGQSLAHALRRISPKLRVVLVSGYPAAPTRSKSNRSPATRRLQKPDSGSTLIAEIHRALKTRRQRAAAGGGSKSLAR
jgi:two-component system, cell cycle sensor histidine kinase and response regulator CckA